MQATKQRRFLTCDLRVLAELNETLLVFVAETTDGCFLVVRVVREVEPRLLEQVRAAVVVGVDIAAFIEIPQV